MRPSIELVRRCCPAVGLALCLGGAFVAAQPGGAGPQLAAYPVDLTHDPWYIVGALDGLGVRAAKRVVRTRDLVGPAGPAMLALTTRRLHRWRNDLQPPQPADEHTPLARF